MKVKIIFFFILLSLTATAQVKSFKSAEYPLFKGEKKRIYTLWTEYIDSWQSDSVNKRIFWKDGVDLLASEGFFSPSLYELEFYNQVLDIHQLNDQQYNVRSMFYWIGEPDTLNTMAIIDVLAEKVGDKFLFQNHLTVHTNDWKSEKIGDIVYHFPKNYEIDKKNAATAASFLAKLYHDFEIKNHPIDYYIFENCYSLQQGKGFNYVTTMSYDSACGFYDTENHIVYSTKNNGEFHTHELIHVINEKYPEAHYILLSGLATYHNYQRATGSYSLHQLFSNLSAYVQKQKIKTLDILDFPTFDKRVGGHYLIGAILIDLILEKGGIDLLKKVLLEVKSDADLTLFLGNNFNSGELNTMIKSKILEMSDKKFKTKL